MKNIISVMSSTYAHYGLEEALEGIRAAGFGYVELATIPGMMDHVFYDPTDIKKSSKLCEKYGLTILAIGAHERLMKANAVESFKKCIDWASDVGASYITTGAGEVKDEKDEERFYMEITQLGNYAKKKNITICLEIHGDWLNNGRIATEVVEKIGMENVRINYDTANVIFYGNTRPEEDLINAVNYLGYVHLKDKKGGYKVWDFPPLGEGEIDFKKIFGILKEYRGPMSVEIEFDGKRHPLSEINDALRKSYKFLAQFCLLS